MADFFISYARADRAKVELLASALEAEGWSVWWDRHIGSGSEFSADIERELNAAKAVIVCWSREGVKSKWVKDEATLAARADKLKTISLDGTEPPIGYMQYHALDMSGWKGDPKDSVFVSLKEDARNHFQKTATGAPVSEAVAERESAPAPVAETKKPLPIAMLAAAALALTVVAAGVFFATSGKAPQTEPANTKIAVTAPAQASVEDSSIAVLPFVNMSSDPEQEYFSDGISEELLNVLAQVQELQVAGRTSAFAFKGQNKDLREIAEVLDVAHILEGSVRKAGNKVRITAQLIRADNGFHLWSQTYDRDLDDIFAVQDEIANAILAELTPHLMGGKKVETARADIGAYDLYLLAKQRAAPGDLAGYEAAASALDQAIEIDPEFAPAYAWRAYYEFMMSDDAGASGDIPIEEALPRAQVWTSKALALAPDLPDSLFAQASLYLSSGQFDLAEAFYKRALEAKPNFDLARNDYAFMLSLQRRMSEATEQLELALAHNPAQTDANTNLVSNYMRMNKVDAAQNALERWARISPDSTVLKYMKASYAWRTGDLADAINLAIENLAANPDDPRIKAQLMVGWIDIGEFQRAIDGDVDNLKPYAYSMSGQRDIALRLTRAELAKRPDYFRAQQNYFAELYFQENWSALVEYFDKKYGDIAAFENDFSYPPYERFAASLKAASHPQAKNMLQAGWAFTNDARKAGVESPDLDRLEAILKTTDGKYGDAVALLQSAIEKNGWWIDIGMDPVLSRLKDTPGFIEIVNATEDKINTERAKLDLAPITLQRIWESTSAKN